MQRRRGVQAMASAKSGSHSGGVAEAPAGSNSQTEHWLPTNSLWSDPSQLPPRLRSDTPGTWAHDTMSRRVRTDILARVFTENADRLKEDVQAAVDLRHLDSELENAATVKLGEHFLQDDGGPDLNAWRAYITPFEDDTWLTAPWLVTEFYFYRKIMSAFRWFEKGIDPFTQQKERGVISSLEPMAALAARMKDLLTSLGGESQDHLAAQEAGFRLLLYTSLWGNRMDLSLWPVLGDEKKDVKDKDGHSGRREADAVSDAIRAGSEDLLWDDSDRVWDALIKLQKTSGPKRVDIIVDNAGFELFTDLCLADFIVESGLADCVALRLKAHPTFVSDAMPKDVEWMTDALAQAEDKDLSALAERWRSHVTSGKWSLLPDYFWVQPPAFWEMASSLVDELSPSGLVIVKGDANYRRLLGDRDWPHSQPFDEVCGYFPAPLCALRTLKAELACGIPPEQEERAKAADPKWLVSGRFGVVQYTDVGVRSPQT
eukprot:jgi/Chlat1/6106/Chrsp40S09029